MRTQAQPMLDGLLVLEVAEGVAGPFCGRSLADLGARVIKIEQPLVGDSSRRHGPFPDDRPNLERSGLFHMLNAGKESVTLDLLAKKGQHQFRRLTSQADVVISDHRPNDRRAMGLGYPVLKALNPGLILTSVTCFGQSGPYAEWNGRDIAASAMGGVSMGAGDPHREPLVLPFQLCDYQGGQAALAATLMALLARDATGQGQHVDIATEEVLSTLHVGNLSVVYLYRGIAGIRAGHRTGVGIYPRTVLPCKDGYVSITFLQREEWRRLMDMLGNPEWSRQPRYQNLRAMSEEYPDEVDALLCEWLKQHTKAEIFQMCQERHIPVAPVLTIDEVSGNEHLAARGFFRRYESPEMPALPLPRLPWLVEGEAPQPARRAPRLGEHNQSVSEEISTAKIQRALKRLDLSGKETSGALAGFRVLDFGRVMAGPLCSRLLADMGAAVIKVESRVHMEPGRRGRPAVGDDIAGGDRGRWPELQPAFHSLNRNKPGVLADFTKPEAIELLARLAAISDVIVENFAPGVMDRLGLGYEALRKRNPSLIYLSMSTPGATGPLRHIIGYATVNQALSGQSSLIGYEDGQVLGMMQAAYADVSGAIAGAAAVCAALVRRNHTGRGAHIDLSQWENVAQFMVEPLADWAMHGRVARPSGNQHPHQSPFGTYFCQGEDKWIAIGVATEDEWRQLCTVMGHPEWLKDSRFVDVASRKAHRSELDALITEACRSRDARELAERLQARGVCASQVMNIEEIIHNAHHKVRGTFIEVEHPLVGYEIQPGFPLRLTASPGSYRLHAPTLGIGNAQVYCDTLGLAASDLLHLVEEGVVG